ncbi:MAG: hypothetical protein A2513_03560 [Sulfurimonas sp. RIFOXYD12_FULL_33_39]|uniref:efflux RND transporter periplasmic adaptor subunit n=1 Tax=unclassified Sulfurimonas TaxID=2623549 RepID=UPI0008AE1569|nr:MULTISPECIES: efflux RND transporter periplasmic adaptor subunit [unclassified Sulfurimonas]OHE09217.1 MAG: hypothetical protein A2513_03560 [Sulfurimonas sp. RIFOXYD12_FULL_33_39]OHE13000.1 MAG: hypothetical protein A2530_05245 [Sulfurimonas sp. RIFOXYD2_FULL_34_21]DAB28432.1 MAG TPA: hypothetical protein CFH78_02470 [Sulfurimonas sp. UBA10385]
MKKFTILQLLLSISLLADITLTLEQEKNWQIETALAKEVSYIPLGEYMMSVKTPPNLMHTISLPYEAQVVKLNRVSFERVKKGDVLALLSASEWIEAQKSAIADSITQLQSQNEANRKSKLCKEEIIAQKECIAAESQLKTDTIKLLASKALLRAYGADSKMIETLSKDLSITPNIKLLSPVDGTLLQVNIEPGKSISSSSAIFVIKTDGDNWVESDLSQEAASKLKPMQEVLLNIDNREIKIKVLHVSPILNSQNQTRHVRFSLPKDENLLDGLRTKAKLSIEGKAFIVNKKAVVQDGSKNILFIKEGLTYKEQEVKLLLEDKDICYISHDTALDGQIVINGTSVLQNMLQQAQE